jgi:hypothetical protein
MHKKNNHFIISFDKIIKSLLFLLLVLLQANQKKSDKNIFSIHKSKFKLD